MKRIVAAMALAAAPAQADVTGQTCSVVWARMQAGVETLGMGDIALTGTVQPPEGAVCVYADVTLDFTQKFRPDFLADRLTITGGLMQWLMGDAVPPDALDLQATGLRMVVRTGSVSIDYYLEAQARAYPTTGALSLRWDADTRLMRLTNLSLGLPGRNEIVLTMTVAGARDPLSFLTVTDLPGLSVTEADLAITTHGMFETYALPVIAPLILMENSDPDADVAQMRAEVAGLVALVPPVVMSDASKDAVAQLLEEFPNPAGRLDIGFRADPGFGAVRFAGFAINGPPQTIEDAAPLYQGVTVDVGWTHEDVAP